MKKQNTHRLDRSEAEEIYDILESRGRANPKKRNSFIRAVTKGDIDVPIELAGIPDTFNIQLAKDYWIVYTPNKNRVTSHHQRLKDKVNDSLEMMCLKFM